MRKLVLGLMTLALLAAAVSPTWAARKGRKLPVSAYIKSAKIEILSGDQERYKTAAALLDSLFMHYGYHAEGLYWYNQMSVDAIETAPGPVEKKPHVVMMVAYADTLHVACADPEVKKKYLKGCDDFIQKVDSINVKYWRQFYNAAIEQLNLLGDKRIELQGTTDSAITDLLQRDMDALFDSCLANCELAMIIDDADARTYIAMGSAFSYMDKTDEAIEWKSRGIEAVESSLATAREAGLEDTINIQESRAMLLESVAYDHVNAGNYDKAIPFLSEFVLQNPANTESAFNLSICLNNAGMYDSAASVQLFVLEQDPAHLDALEGMGRYFNEMGRRAVDSVRKYEEAGDGDNEQLWKDHRQAYFDSSRVYFKRAFEVDPSKLFITEMYALTSALTQNFEDAVAAFSKMTELQPDNWENFLSLGDSHFNLKQWEDAAGAYERAAELNPDHKEIWEQLAFIYKQLGMADKEKEARSHL